MRLSTALRKVIGAVALVVGFATTLVVLASPVSAMSAVSLNLPVTVVRGSSPAWSVTFSGVENEQLHLSLLQAAQSLTSTLTCTATNGVPCNMVSANGGDFSLGNNGTGATNETAQVTISGTVYTQNLGFTSTEGADVPSAIRTFQIKLDSLSYGTTASDTKSTTVTEANGDAEIRMSTKPVSPAAVSRKDGNTVTYSADLTRVANTNQTTNVSVQLAANSAKGTTVSSTNPATVSFAPGETVKTVSYTVAVPSSATLGAASYHLVATYDPNGTDGSPVDTEIGNLASFDVLGNPAVTADYSLFDVTSPGGTFDQGDVVRVAYTIANSGDAAATHVVFEDLVGASLEDLGNFRMSHPGAGTWPLSAPAGDDALTYDSSTHTISLNMGADGGVAAAGTLPAGEAYTLTYDAAVGQGGTPEPGARATISNERVVHTDQGDYAAATDTQELRTVGLTLTQTASHAAEMGSQVDHTLTVANAGPDEAPAVTVQISVAGGNISGLPHGCTPTIDYSVTQAECALSPGFESDGRTVRITRSTPGQLTVVAHVVPTADFDAVHSADQMSTITFVDSAAPTVGLVSPTTVFTPTKASSVKLAWAGSDVGTGIGSYDVRYRKASYSSGWSSFTTVTGLTGTSRSFALAPGETWCFQVLAHDKANNVSGWTTARCVARPLDDAKLAATARWARGKASGYYLGTYTSTTASGAVLSLRGAQVTRVGIVATTCSACGSVEVFVGGVSVGRRSLASSTTAKQQILMLPAFALKSGAVTVKSTTSGKRIDIDGLVLSRA